MRLDSGPTKGDALDRLIREGITLGLVTRNRPGYLRAILKETFAMQSIRLCKVIVYDNSEQLDTSEVVAGFPEVTYIRGTKMQPGGRNEILRRVSTSVVCFLDDDVGLTFGYFDTVWEDFHKYPNAAVVGGPAILVSNAGSPVRRIHGGYGYNRVTRTVKSILKADHSQCWIPDEICEVDFVPGGNMCFRTSLLLRVGGFDEAYERGTSFHEETDPQLSLREKGYSILYDPNLRVRHFNAPTGGGRADVRKVKLIANRFHNGRNQVYLLRKHKMLSVFVLREVWSEMIRNIILTKTPALFAQTGVFDATRGKTRSIEGWFPRYLDEVSAGLFLFAGNVSELICPSESQPIDVIRMHRRM